MRLILSTIVALVGTFLIGFKLGFNYGWRGSVFDQLYRRALEIQKEREKQNG